MNWTPAHHIEGAFHCGIYTIYRGVQDYMVYKFGTEEGMKLVGRAESRLEAELLASVDAASVKVTP